MLESYTKEEVRLFKKLNTPAKIQDFLNKLPFNFEKKGETCMSPRMVLEKKTAHCMEGALFGAAILEYHGHQPLILDLRSAKKPFDFDHVVAIWNEDGFYGAISKTNHGVLRYREPVYKSIRELVMSYFHEYFLNSTGLKTLREYSDPFDLNHFNKINWRTSEKDLFEIPKYLDKTTHHQILTKKQIKNLRKADKIEIEVGKIEEYKK
ncbi:MAG: hypothetical protein AB201_00745 [Parcubacteria bacterium C7867-006]|nr:MAG: hypothetical protein AB201_00745 [Parcubacteria bacterium C7867-006]